jgi:hydroxyacylglutathione hydrolase
MGERSEIHYAVAMTMQVEMICGGAVQTNGFLISIQGESLLVDAPEGMLDWAQDHLQRQKQKPLALLLTHGHWDHIAEAAQIREKLGIPVLIHADSLPLLEHPEIQSAFNPFLIIKPCKADQIIRTEDCIQIGPFHFKPLHCPGHCPGSVCFHFEKESKLFGGDVLFAGGVGRWDLPGGSQRVLLDSIRTRLLVLKDDVEVFPGHGESTTIGEERRNNPFLSSLTVPK